MHRNSLRRASFLSATVVAVTCARVNAVELRGHVIDAVTRAPLGSRLYIERDDGTQFHAASVNGSAVPYKKQRGKNSSEIHTSLSAHEFRTDLPAGRYTLTVERGKEYLPATKNVEIADDAVAVTLELRRWINLADRGWYSGETHVHRSLAELPTAMLAEDLNVAFPLSYWVTKAYVAPSAGDKSSAAAVPHDLIKVDDTHVIWPVNTEYEIFTVNGKRNTLGAVFLLNHKTPLELGAPPVTPIAKEARRQGALLDLDKHSWPWSLMLIPTMNVDLFELTNNHVWRTEFFFRNWTIEAAPANWNFQQHPEGGFTESSWIDFGFRTYYALLNCGFRLRPTAGTASGVHPVPLGFGRVYVHLPNGFSYNEWIKGLDAGRSFVTTGPMLFVEVDGLPPGTQTTSSAGSQTRRITGTAQSQHPLDRIEVIHNGDVVESITPENRSMKLGYESIFEVEVDTQGSGWIAVRCFEERPNSRFRFAHSSPVHFDVPESPLKPRPAEVRYFIQRMEEELARNVDVLHDDDLREYEHALEVYRSLMNRAAKPL